METFQSDIWLVWMFKTLKYMNSRINVWVEKKNHLRSSGYDILKCPMSIEMSIWPMTCIGLLLYFECCLTNWAISPLMPGGNKKGYTWWLPPGIRGLEYTSW